MALLFFGGHAGGLSIKISNGICSISTFLISSKINISHSCMCDDTKILYQTCWYWYMQVIYTANVYTWCDCRTCAKYGCLSYIRLLIIGHFGNLHTPKIMNPYTLHYPKVGLIACFLWIIYFYIYIKYTHAGKLCLSSDADDSNVFCIEYIEEICIWPMLLWTDTGAIIQGNHWVP